MADNTKKLHLAEGQGPILSDKEISEISEFTLFPEADGIYFEMEGISFGFWRAAEEVVAASAAQASRLMTGQAHALFYMRSFYLLGVLRGAEAYRFSLIDEDDGPKEIPFVLDEHCAEDFREALENMPPELFQRLCALLGLSVQWTDGPKD